jgi:hypothetical protein
MKKNTAAPLPLIAILLLSSFVSWRASAAENARTVDALPGVRRIGFANAPGARMFQLALDASPETIARAFLVYELAGVPHWTATVRSINGLPAEGGFGAVASSGTALQMEEINPRWLRKGLNQIVFFPAPGSAAAPVGLSNLRERDSLAAAEPDGTVPYTVRNLRLVYLDGTAKPAPRLQLSHPLQGENDGTGTVLRGFVDPAGLPTGPAELFVDGVYVPDGIDPADGSFAVFVPRGAAQGEPWEAEIEVVYPDGSRLHRSVKLAGDTHCDEDADDSAELTNVTSNPANCSYACTITNNATQVAIKPGDHLQLTANVVNSSSQPCDADVAFAASSQDLKVTSPAPAASHLHLNAGASGAVTASVEVNPHQGSSPTIVTVNVSNNRCKLDVQYCIIPTGESSALFGWKPGSDTDIASFKANLSPSTTDFDGRTVSESERTADARDGCYVSGNPLIKDFSHGGLVTGAIWTVGQVAHGEWGVDSIGFFYDAEAVYAQSGRQLPCSMSTTQIMSMNCPWGYEEYTKNSFLITLPTGGTTVSRGNATAGPH